MINAPPQANVGQSVTFDGRNSTAAAPIAQYRWTFGDGGTAEGARVSYIYRAPGVYNVTLVIIDEANREGTANTQIEIIATATATPQPSPLIGTSWLMTAYFDGATGLVPALPGVAVTALFGANGSQLTGSGGCNDYTATYAASGEVLSIGLPAVTGRSCTEPPGIAEQEQAFFSAFPSVVGYRISPGRLELTGLGKHRATPILTTGATTMTPIREAFDRGEGVFRLAPNWVPHNFNRAGGRLRLHPDDYFAFGHAARLDQGALVLLDGIHRRTVRRSLPTPG